MNNTPSIAVLIPDRTDNTLSHLPWRYFPETMDPGHTWKWSFHPFCSLPVCRLVRYKSEADLPLNQIIADNGVHRVLANARFLRNQSYRQSPILLSAFVTFSRSFLGFCLSMADPNVAHPQSFSSLCESVWTIRKHIFCSRLPSRPAPTFNASLLQFSPICSRTWCLHLALLRCHSTAHTDYVHLAVVGLHCRSHAVHAVCRFFPFLWRTMCMHAHMRQVNFQMTPFTELFRHTLYSNSLSMSIFLLSFI